MADWHLSDDVAAALAAEPTRIDHVMAASTEQHLFAFPRCQEAVARHGGARGLFAPGAEPAGECGLATPIHGIGLLVRRVAVVEISALVVLGSSAVLIDRPMVVAIGWLLPSLALSVGTIAGAARWPTTLVGGALSVGWVAAVLTATWLGRASRVTQSFAFDAVAQGLVGALAVLGVAVIAIRRQVLYMEVLR